MKITTVVISWCAVAVLMAPLLQCRSRQGNAVVIKGSTTMAPVIREAADKFTAKKSVKFQIEGKGSHGGIFSLLEGRCDIAESSVPINDREMEIARARGLSIREYIIAHDMIVPIVNPANTLSGLTSDELRRIFNGSIKSWKDAGGKDLPVTIVIRDDTSGTRDVWERKVTQSAGIPGIIEKSSNSAVLAEVAHTEGAIGYVSFSFLNRDVRALKVDGVAPSIDNALKGTYVLKRSLYLYVNEKSITGNARAFIVFLLSREGQRIFRENGFIPVSGSE